MTPLSGWCGRMDQKVNGHELTILTGLAGKAGIALDELAAAVPAHYAAEERIARIFSRLGKKRAAEYVRQKLPKSKNIRSGDLGEILGSEYIKEASLANWNSRLRIWTRMRKGPFLRCLSMNRLPPGRSAGTAGPSRAPPVISGFHRL